MDDLKRPVNPAEVPGYIYLPKDQLPKYRGPLQHLPLARRKDAIRRAEEAEAKAAASAAAPKVPEKPNPGASMVASASRITSRTLDRKKAGGTGKSAASDLSWQQDAWDIYDQVGELRFITTTISGQLSKATLFVGESNPATPESPIPTEDDKLTNMLVTLGNGNIARMSQHLYRLSLNLMIAGEAWMVGVPKSKMHDDGSPTAQADAATSRPTPAFDLTPGDGADTVDAIDDLENLEWFTLSVDEVEFTRDGTVKVSLPSVEKLESTADELYVIRIWDPHPRKSANADSPTRSSLPVLREIVGLTQHVGAQVDSRLAGAGLLAVPQSAADAMRAQLGIADANADPFTELLVDAMTTPIRDRNNASAVVPLVVTVPDEAADKFTHINFSSSLDTEARNLREEAIRRLALGQDAPPELLLGMSQGNHWSAWLVSEETVRTHIEPRLALICDALTSQYLHPVLRENGVDEARISQLTIWYDVEHLISQPTRLNDAQRLFELGVISDETLRDLSGFSDTDAPKDSGDPAVTLALEMLKSAPSLAQAPGLSVLVEQIRAALDGEVSATPPATGADASAEPESTDGGPPAPDDLTDGPDLEVPRD